RTGRAKGLAERRVVFRHALRNAAIPVLTVIGLQIGALLGGAVITESIFAWPGMGKLIVDAIFFRDFPVVQTVLILSATVFVVINLAVDLLYTVIDPRIRYLCCAAGCHATPPWPSAAASLGWWWRQVSSLPFSPSTIR